MVSMLLAPVANYTARQAILGVLNILMFIAAIAAIILVLIQPSNSDGTDALSGGSSDSYFGKNKGKSTESILKKWTIVALAVLAVLAIASFLIQALWK